MPQSKLMSFLEANANAVVGLIVSWLFNYFVLPLFGLITTPLQAAGITGLFFIISTLRSYIIRRLFNRVS